ncbi:MAG: fumarate hydratase C-terminal domain-containing protein [Candidatus Omnitrophica bacterium]|nr:fumarate hydratase C-terminal domain-containing protein [Candidatus Omnitrophota bacterium]
MGKIKRISSPFSEKEIISLKAGEMVLLSGIILTARDQAHKRIFELIAKGEALPLDLQGQTIYYCGPTPPGNRVIGSCGPTTSGRMDPFTPEILAMGVKALIGKGRRSEDVLQAIKKEKASYFVAPAGAGAYLQKKVISSKVLCFRDLGPEAIYELEVKDFPLVVGIDAKGKDIYSRLK